MTEKLRVRLWGMQVRPSVLWAISSLSVGPLGCGGGGGGGGTELEEKKTAALAQGGGRGCGRKSRRRVCRCRSILGAGWWSGGVGGREGGEVLARKWMAVVVWA